MAVTLDQVSQVPRRDTFPPIGALGLRGRYRLAPELAIVAARLAPPSTPPCEGGAFATTLAVAHDIAAKIDARRGAFVAQPTSTSTGKLFAGFRRDEVEPQGLMSASPSFLDLSMVHGDGSPGRECLRVPFLRGEPGEWLQPAHVSLGMGFRLVVPLRRIYGMAAAPMLMLRGGPWLGPMRVRLELGAGGAASSGPEVTNPNLVGYTYSAGVVVDGEVLHRHSLGISLGAGYDVTGISYAANIDAFSHDGAGFRGLFHGPRAGVSVEWNSERSPGLSFLARSNAASGSVEVFGEAAWSDDHAGPVPALWVALSGDLSL